MTTEQQRIAIAEACGWKWYKMYPLKTGEHRYRYLLHPDLLPCLDGFEPADMEKPVCNLLYLWGTGKIPDYLNDLNACHEMEQVLDAESKRMAYSSKLGKILDRDTPEYEMTFEWSATAAQRCEAFLKTLNLWSSVSSVGCALPASVAKIDRDPNSDS